jgi:hypothetical protein
MLILREPVGGDVHTQPCFVQKEQLQALSRFVVCCFQSAGVWGSSSGSAYNSREVASALPLASGGSSYVTVSWASRSPAYPCFRSSPMQRAFKNGALYRVRTQRPMVKTENASVRSSKLTAPNVASTCYMIVPQVSVT